MGKQLGRVLAAAIVSLQLSTNAGCGAPYPVTGNRAGAIDVWNARTFVYLGTIQRTATGSSTTFQSVRRVFRWGQAGLITLLIGSSSTLDQDVLWIVDDLDAALPRR